MDGLKACLEQIGLSGLEGILKTRIPVPSYLLYSRLHPRRAMGPHFVGRAAYRYGRLYKEISLDPTPPLRWYH